MRLRQLCTIALAAVFATGLAGAAVADDIPLTRDGDTLVLKAPQQTLTMPLPDWLSADQLQKSDTIALLELSFLGSDTDAQIEIFPKGETQKNWKTRYGARVLVHNDEPLKNFREALMTIFSKTCPAAQTGFFQTEPDDGDNLATLGFICAAYDPTGPQAGKGEVALLQFKKTAKGVGLVYEDWRGAAFDAGKPATWPISSDALLARSAQFKSIVSLAAAN